MAKTNSIVIEIEGDSIKAIKSVDGVVTELGKLERKAKEAKGPLDKIADGLGMSLGGLTTGAIITGIGLMIKSAIDLGDKLHDMSQKTGVAVETLSVLDYAAKMNGTDIDTLSGLFVKFNKNIYEAATKGGDAANTFQRLGVQLKDNEGNLKNTEQLFGEVTKKVSNMPDGVTKTATALQMFGRSGQEAIPIINDLGENFGAYREEVTNLGLLITTEFANKADAFNDNIERMKGAVMGMAVQVADDVLPTLTAMSVAMIQVGSDSQNTTPIIGLLGGGIKFLATVVGGAVSGLIVMAEVVGTIGAVIAKAVTFQWGDIPATFKAGFAQIKSTSLEAGKMFDAMWNPEKYQAAGDALANYFGGAVGDATNGAKKLADEWKRTELQLQHENMLVGLNAFEQKEKQLIWQADELKKKFYEIPGAIDLINFNLDQKIADLYKIKPAEINKIQQGLQLPEMKDAFQISPAIDTTGMEANINKIKDKTQEVSTESALHFGIMEMAGTDSFGMIGDSLMKFATLNGKTNKEMFAAAKAFSIGQAIMNTYEGASKAIAQGGIFGGIMAAAVIAMGMAQVARIASTQPSSAGGGGSSVGSSISPNSLTNGSGARAYANSVTNNNSSKQVTVTLVVNGDVIDADQWFRKNKSSIQKLINDGIINTGNG